MPRDLRYPVRLTVPLSEDDAQALNSARAEGETRLDVIREAIRRELRRRERKAAPVE